MRSLYYATKNNIGLQQYLLNLHDTVPLSAESLTINLKLPEEQSNRKYKTIKQYTSILNIEYAYK